MDVHSAHAIQLMLHGAREHANMQTRRHVTVYEVSIKLNFHETSCLHLGFMMLNAGLYGSNYVRTSKYLHFWKLWRTKELLAKFSPTLHSDIFANLSLHNQQRYLLALLSECGGGSITTRTCKACFFLAECFTGIWSFR